MKVAHDSCDACIQFGSTALTNINGTQSLVQAEKSLLLYYSSSRLDRTERSFSDHDAGWLVIIHFDVVHVVHVVSVAAVVAVVDDGRVRSTTVGLVHWLPPDR